MCSLFSMVITLLASQGITDNVRQSEKYSMECILTFSFLPSMSCAIPILIYDKNSQGQTMLTEWYLARNFRHMKYNLFGTKVFTK